jgi:hypothetical protein
VRARFSNTSPSALVAPARLAATLSAALALAGGLAACGGGGSPGAQSLLNDTFASHMPIRSGRLELSVGLSPAGPAGSGASERPFAARLAGPFQSLGSGRLPQFAMALSLSPTRAGALHAGVTATGGRLFVEFQGTPFLAPQSTADALARGYAEASRATSSGGSRSSFAPLGIDPARWLTHPALAPRAAGAETVHIVAGLDAARFCADAAKLLGALGSLDMAIGGPGGPGGGGPGSLAQGRLAALAGSVRSASVDVYSGAADHILRRLSVNAALASTARAGATVASPRDATLTLVLQFAELNRLQRIVAPSRPRPFAQLLGVVERLGLLTRSRSGG